MWSICECKIHSCFSATILRVKMAYFVHKFNASRLSISTKMILLRNLPFTWYNSPIESCIQIYFKGIFWSSPFS